ncbi:hypothetical protein KI387_043414, partial [Taxus chinensis]
MPQITLDHGLLMAIAERWHSESQCFRLPTGEITITLEDVWRIMRIPIIGQPIQYVSDRAVLDGCIAQLFGVPTLPRHGMM